MMTVFTVSMLLWIDRQPKEDKSCALNCTRLKLHALKSLCWQHLSGSCHWILLLSRILSKIFINRQEPGKWIKNLSMFSGRPTLWHPSYVQTKLKVYKRMVLFAPICLNLKFVLAAFSSNHFLSVLQIILSSKEVSVVKTS